MNQLIPAGADLAAALADAPPGARLQLAPGDYLVSAPLTHGRDLTLTGAVDGTTRLVAKLAQPAQAVLHLTGGHFEASGLTFLLTGATLAPWLHAADAQLTLSQCRVLGDGESPPAPHGEGVVLTGAASGHFTDCEIYLVHGGVKLRDTAMLQLSTCRIWGCLGSGVIAAGDATVTAQGNSVYANDGCGVELHGMATARLSGNTLRGNGRDGLYLTSHAPLHVEGNLLAANRRAGLRVEDGARPVLRGNTLESNQADGLLFLTGGSGEVAGNRARGNRCNGLAAEDAPHLVVSDNQMEGNGGSGIYLGGATTATLRTNQCVGNGLHGLALSDTAILTASGNLVSGNGGFGLLQAGSGAVALTGNVFSDNALGD